MEKTNKIQKNYWLGLLSKQASKAGFSLIEVLVALFILSIGLVGVSFLMTGNISNSEKAKNQIVSAQLAQEGIELVRNLKDNKNAALDALTAGTYDYRIDKTMANLDNNSSYLLYITGNFYTHNPAPSGTQTKFYRKISLKITGDKAEIPSTREITVTSIVSWNGAGIPSPCNVANKCVSAVSVLPDAT